MVVVAKGSGIQEEGGVLSSAQWAGFLATWLLRAAAVRARTNFALILGLIHFTPAGTQGVVCLDIAVPHTIVVGAAPTTAALALRERTIVARMHLQVVGQMVAVVVAGAAVPLQMVAVAAGLLILQRFPAWKLQTFSAVTSPARLYRSPIKGLS